MLPNFLIAGTQKSGTTFLYNLISNHHQVRMPKRSMDRSFFDDDRIYVKGLEWYESLFEEYKNEDGVIIGQVSADCSFNKGSIERIKKDIPDTKLIFVLRHPVDRAYSQYWFMYGNGVEPRKINEAFRNEEKRVRRSYYNYKMYSYLGRSKYKSQFDEVYQNFNKKNVLIIPFDSLINDTVNTLNVVFDFIGADRINDIDQLNRGSVSKNPAKLPQFHFITVISYYLQKIGLKSVGKRLINLVRKEKRPPKIDDTLRSEIEMKLKDDIIFFESVKNDFVNNRL